MSDESISVIDAARELGVQKQRLFKLLKRLNIDKSKERHSAHRGQAIAYIAAEDLERIREYLDDQGRERTPEVESQGGGNPIDNGWFYLIQTEPTNDPGRFKVGFASNMSDRLRQHKCSAPFAEVVDKWPCLRRWEQTAIDSVTQGCERIGTEVYRSTDLAGVRERCTRFFDLQIKLPPCGWGTYLK